MGQLQPLSLGNTWVVWELCCLLCTRHICQGLYCLLVICCQECLALVPNTRTHLTQHANNNVMMTDTLNQICIRVTGFISGWQQYLCIDKEEKYFQRGVDFETRKWLYYQKKKKQYVLLCKLECQGYFTLKDALISTMLSLPNLRMSFAKKIARAHNKKCIKKYIIGAPLFSLCTTSTYYYLRYAPCCHNSNQRETLGLNEDK